MGRKKLAVLFAAIMAITALTGCGNSGGDAEESRTPTAVQSQTETEQSTEEGAQLSEVSGKITIWVWTDISGEIADYESKHPGTEIEQVVIDAGDYLTKLQTTVASGGTLPDLVWGEISNRGQLFEMNILDDLETAPYNFDTSTVDASVLPTMTTEDGTVVGVERNLTPAGLAYHRNLAEKFLGTSAPDEVSVMLASWDAFIELGQKVSEESGGTVKMFSSLGDVYYIINGQMDEARISGGVINKAAVLELFTQICRFRDAGIVGKLEQWSPAWFASFGTEDTIFSPMPTFGESDWIAPNVEGDSADWALIVPPEGGFSWGGTCWGVTKDSQNKELAWDFIQYDSFGDGLEIRFGNGEIPSTAGYMTEDKVQRESAYFDNQKIMEVFVNDIIPTVSTRVPTAYDYADICTIELVLSSLNTDYSMTPQQALDTYIAEMQNQAPELTAE